MSDFNIGDKVYLEGKISRYDASDNTYCVDYFDYHKDTYSTVWVKDDVLHPADDAYNKGLNDAWNLAKKIVLPSHMGGYTMDEFKNIFDKNTYISAMSDFTPQEALAKVKAYEERNEIKVGDVVKFRGDCIESIVTKVDGYIVYRLFKDGSCNLFHYNKGDLVKTGKHFDSIDEFMRSAD
jgi:hypothetical protein